MSKKKAEHFCSTFVGVAGFEPAASCSQSRRDNRATLHPESGCKYITIFGLYKTILEIRTIFFESNSTLDYLNKSKNKII
jgi:hypothetical protein